MSFSWMVVESCEKKEKMVGKSEVGDRCNGGARSQATLALTVTGCHGKGAFHGTERKDTMEDEKKNEQNLTIPEFSELTVDRGEILFPFIGRLTPEDPLYRMPLKTLKSLSEALLAAKSSATRRVYLSRWRAFLKYCEENGLASLPTHPQIVAAYVSSINDERKEKGKKEITISYINTVIAAIAYVHKVVGLHVDMTDPIVETARRGLENIYLVRPKNQKNPILTPMLEHLVSVFDRNTLLGKRNIAILTLGYMGAFRRSELAALTVDDLTFSGKGVEVLVKKSKTDQRGEGKTKWIVRQDEELKLICAVRAVKDWLSSSQISSGYVFRDMRTNVVGSTKLSGEAIASIVKRAIKKIDEDPTKYAGHSLRSGFVTDRFDHGVDIGSIMQITGHERVDTVRRYDRRSVMSNTATKMSRKTPEHLTEDDEK